MPHTLFARNNRINVPDDFVKIQDAINSSVDGDTILVAPGTYFENINFRGKNVLLSSYYLFDEDVSFINTTIIDGSNPQLPDTASVVIFLNGENNTAILQGFTITGGKGTKNFDTDGNFFVRTGGGIIILRSSPTIRHNIIAFNESINSAGVSHQGGGGISVNHSSAIISNNLIYKNNGNDGGGLVLGRNSGTVIRNNIIAYNTTIPTGIGGGGFFIFGKQGKIINNTIAFNQSNKRGGIEIQDDATVNLENCIIYGNKSGSSNTQIGGSGHFNITNTNIEGGWAGAGNIDENPMFIENTPLILQDASPCVDKGDTSAANYDWEDQDNPGFALSPALGTLRNDMGAYGGNQYKSMPFSSMEITRIEDENGTTPNKFVLSQNYPNPFNPSTLINYSIPDNSFVTIKVYDLLGKEVATLVNEEKPFGNYAVEFDGSDLSSGVYFYRMQAGGFSNIKKFILL
ncbi:MAG: T9SS type A sorting domain-containing protein, partial [Ignavibacteriaceae bacterium]